VSYGKRNNLGNQERSYPFGTHWSSLRPGGMAGRREILVRLLRGDTDNVAMTDDYFYVRMGLAIQHLTGKGFVSESRSSNF